MSNILDQIAEHKRFEVDQLKALRPLARFVDRIPNDRSFSFKGALSGRGPVKIIAEIKKASPSKGILQVEFHPDLLAQQYKAGGAVALSVLTDSRFFQGAHEYMEIAKQASGLPILCKDFIIDPYQLYFAKYMGADAVLLIVNLLTRRNLLEFQQLAQELGLDCLVEAHTEGELEIAIDSGADIIGVNSRNLQDFSVTLETAGKLGEMIPSDRIKVAESGIVTPRDILQLKATGYDCFLIGEALITAADPIGLLQAMQQA